MSEMKRIVAIDDCGIMVKKLQNVLEKTYEFKGFTQGSYALKYLTERGADLVVLDIEMPDINGFDLSKKIKALANMKDVPILFLTSNTDREHVIQSVRAGGDDYAIKPIDEEVIMDKLKKLLMEEAPSQE